MNRHDVATVLLASAAVARACEEDPLLWRSLRQVNRACAAAMPAPLARHGARRASAVCRGGSDDAVLFRAPGDATQTRLPDHWYYSHEAYLWVDDAGRRQAPDSWRLGGGPRGLVAAAPAALASGLRAFRFRPASDTGGLARFLQQLAGTWGDNGARRVVACLREQQHPAAEDEELMRVVISGPASTALPPCLGAASGVAALRIDDAWFLTELPDSLGRLAPSLTELRLARCGQLRELPESLGDLSRLAVLDLDSCRALRALPQSARRLSPALRRLRVSMCTLLTGCSLDALPGLTRLELSTWCGDDSAAWLSRGTMPRLEDLRLRNFCSDAVPDAVFGPRLTRLDLVYHRMRALPEALARATALAHLDLSHCTGLVALPAWLTSLPLESVDTRYCSPNRLGVPPGALPHLTRLAMDPPATYREAWGPLPKIRELEFTRWSGRHVDPTSLFASATTLVRLHVGCKWVGLSEELWEVRSLTALHISACPARAVSPKLGALTRLQQLRLEHFDNLTELPDMGELASLTRLELNWMCILGSLPASLATAAGLRDLRVSQCEWLTALVPPEGSLGRLTRLALDRLPNLGALRDELPSLRQLVISSCSRLTCLPETTLAGLTSLQVEHCPRLRALPESLGRATGLRELSLSWCLQLAALPAGLGAAAGPLRTLCLRGCPQLTALPETLTRRLPALDCADIDMEYTHGYCGTQYP